MIVGLASKELALSYLPKGAVLYGVFILPHALIKCATPPPVFYPPFHRENPSYQPTFLYLVLHFAVVLPESFPQLKTQRCTSGLLPSLPWTRTPVPRHPRSSDIKELDKLLEHWKEVKDRVNSTFFQVDFCKDGEFRGERVAPVRRRQENHLFLRSTLD